MNGRRGSHNADGFYHIWGVIELRGEVLKVKRRCSSSFRDGGRYVFREALHMDALRSSIDRVIVRNHRKRRMNGGRIEGRAFHLRSRLSTDALASLDLFAIFF